VQEDPSPGDVAQPYKGRKARLSSEITLTSTATERRDDSRNARVEDVEGAERGTEDGGLLVKSLTLSLFQLHDNCNPREKDRCECLLSN